MSTPPLNLDQPPPPPPTTNPDGTPLITVTTFDAADPKPVNPNDPWPDQAAEGVFLLAFWKMRGWGVPRWICWTLGGAAGVAVGCTAYIASALVWAIKSVAPYFAEAVLAFFGDIRKAVDPQIPKIAAGILTELTGANITANNLPLGDTFTAHLIRVTATGSALHDLLESEFAPGGVVSADQGAQAARAFTGFNIDFGIGTAFIALTGELGSLGKLKEFRTLGEEVARNLGLGRLHRLALQPLIKTTIADPYQKHLNAKYLPQRLPAGQAIKAYFRGAMNEATLRSELHEEGWNDDRINNLITDARPLLSDAQTIDLFLQGQASDTAMRAALHQRGWADAEIDLMVTLERPKLEKAEILNLYRFGGIDRPTALKDLQGMGYSATDAESLVHLNELEHPQHAAHVRHLSVAQIHQMYLNGMIDLNQYDDHLTQLGYTADDILALTQELILDAQKAQAKAQAAAAKAAAKAAAAAAKASGTPPTP